MVTDKQVGRLFNLSNKEKTQEIAALKSGMTAKTARKYLKAQKLPSEIAVKHDWRTRKDPYADDWEKILKMLELNGGLEAKTIFEHIQKDKTVKYSEGQLRTLQRRLKIWRVLNGPDKEVFFSQIHYAGDLCESDFTDLSKLNITISGKIFEHLLFHFVLTYSNWETGTICFSESYESLSEGFQNALWELGAVAERHRTDRLSAAVNKECNPELFTERYKSLMNHYGIKSECIQVAKPNENGDIEQRHNRFKRALEQSLLLRGSRDFESVEAYKEFLKNLFVSLNRCRQEKLLEELKVMKPLPAKRLNDCKTITLKVGQSSTVNLAHNTYSVSSRLINEWIICKLYAQKIEVWYAQKKIEELPRIRGEAKHKIEYRHIIGWLIRKPGAFINYRYREDLYPSSNFRMAYDYLLEKHSSKIAVREYLAILHLAAHEGEQPVENILRILLNSGADINSTIIAEKVKTVEKGLAIPEVHIDEVSLNVYDDLLNNREEEVINE